MPIPAGTILQVGQERKVPAGAAALAKGLTLLDLVADAERPLRFAELLNRSGLPKPTFARILRTLMAFDLITQDQERGTYTLGRRFLEMSHQVWDRFDLRVAAAPELERLSGELGETVALCKLDGDEVVYLDERSGDGLKFRVESGRRVPLHCTAAGKALLSVMDPAVARGMLERLDLRSITPGTITGLQQLQAELTLTLARGYAVSQEEHLPGVNSVSCAIIGQDGSPVGALAALGPANRLDPARMHPAGRELIAAARRISGHAGTVAISAHPRPRIRKNRAAAIECLLPWGAQLGEAPIWNGEERRLYWVDILSPEICRLDPETGVNEVCDPGKLVSAVLFGANGSMRVASQDGIENLEFESSRLEPWVNPERGFRLNRLNDAKVGPGGDIWVGSMRLDASKPSGGLYRIAPDGSIERKDSGITVANGLDWSPDGRVFYFVDTIAGCIFAYDFEPDSGRLTNKRRFATVPEEEGRPDGLCVDADGGVWCAIWNGWRVNRYDPDGGIDQVLDMPVPRPTSVAFGGSNLETLFVTSARTRLPAATIAEAPLSGGVFACQPGQRGLPAVRFQ